MIFNLINKKNIKGFIISTKIVFLYRINFINTTAHVFCLLLKKMLYTNLSAIMQKVDTFTSINNSICISLQCTYRGYLKKKKTSHLVISHLLCSYNGMLMQACSHNHIIFRDKTHTNKM